MLQSYQKMLFEAVGLQLKPNPTICECIMTFYNNNNFHGIIKFRI